ncbi:ExeM/NucH family extracellular endonuclease, partial [Oleiphilus sp. HI0132]
VNAILAMNADIVGLMEIENDGFTEQSAIASLVAAINAAGGDYAYIDPGVDQIGTDAIAVGLIYRSTQVKPIKQTVILDSSVDSRFNDDKNRPVLIQTFKEKGSKEKLTVAVNHLKSKGSDCDELGDPDMNDGQGNCNLTRTSAATALVDYLNSDPSNSRDSDFLIIGDLNAYAKEDPVSVIKEAGYVDLFEHFVGDKAYSYVFYGQAGSLDHALASDSLSSQVSGVTEWHINTDEPRVLDYNTEYKSDTQVADLYSASPYRASDHDPVIVELALKSPLKGDFDEDGVLGFADFLILIDHWGCRDQSCAQYDLNKDGKVNFRDIRKWLKWYRKSR